jgi:uncharacterized protein (TIGR03118 family)
MIQQENLMHRKAFQLMAIGLALTAPVAAQFYHQVNLVSDISGVATVTDPLLINPWGVSFNPTSPFWVSNQGSSTATLYAVTGSSDVSKVALSVNIPGPPTGQVFNGSPGFVVSQGGASGPASFLFGQLNGAISGWNSNVPPPVPPATLSTQAILAATGAPAPVAYTGLALGTRSSGMFLYAANNAAGRIDVFDSNFAPVTVPGGFVDAGLPAGNLPFNVVNIGGSLYVTYSGAAGVVNVFDTDGNFQRRFATGGTLLNPWGIALAPADFGKFSHALLIGNFNLGNPAAGPGRISAFDPDTRAFLGLLEDTTGAPLSIDGLWSLTFGNGKQGGASNVLYFTAGIQNQTHGIFGRLAACGPVISGASASPDTLWPPNHKMVLVTLNYTLSDDCDTAPVGSISISSNEGTSADWQVVDLHHVNLLADRAGNGDGRTYTITITYKDTLGLSSSAKVTVTVPHDQGNHGDQGDQGDQGDNGQGKKHGKD